METKKENIKLNSLMFRALDHAIDSVSDGGTLIPFVITETTLTRFVTDRIEDGKKKAEEFLAAQKNEQIIALAYDGYVTRDGAKDDAIFVQAFDRDDEKGILLAQRYIPKKDFSPFQKIGNPAVVQYPNNPLFHE